MGLLIVVQRKFLNPKRHDVYCFHFFWNKEIVYVSLQKRIQRSSWYAMTNLTTKVVLPPMHDFFLARSREVFHIKIWQNRPVTADVRLIFGICSSCYELISLYEKNWSGMERHWRINDYLFTRHFPVECSLGCEFSFKSIEEKGANTLSIGTLFKSKTIEKDGEGEKFFNECRLYAYNSHFVSLSYHSQVSWAQPQLHGSYMYL